MKDNSSLQVPRKSVPTTRAGSPCHVGAFSFLLLALSVSATSCAQPPTTEPADHFQMPKPGVVMDIASARSTWAFGLPKDHPIPALRDATWCKSPLDRFIL